MEIERKAFIESLGGEGAVNKMDSESRADAIEHHMLHELNSAIENKQNGEQAGPKKYPTAAEVVEQIETRP